MLLLVAATAALAGLVQVETKPVVTIIQDVRIFRDDGVVVGPFDVKLADGTIAEIRADLPTGDAELVDGSGRTLLPGLVDAHVHIGSPSWVPGRPRVPNERHTLDAFLYMGVTTVLDPAWDDKAPLKNWDPAPKIYSAGRAYSAKGGHPYSTLTHSFPGNPIVRWLARSTAWYVEGDEVEVRDVALPFLQVVLDDIPHDVPVLTDGALTSIKQQAEAQNRRLLAHVGHPDDIDRALQIGVSGFTHMPYLAPMSDEQAAAIAEADIAVMPTLSVWESIELGVQGRRSLGPIERRILPERIERDFDRTARRGVDLSWELEAWADDLVESRVHRYTNIDRLRAAGVQILVGSESPNLGHVAGAGTHWEIELLHLAGMTPGEVLRAATWGNSRWIDPEAKFGAIREGWEADLILVAGDPTRFIDELHDIEVVWLDGRRVNRLR